MKRLFTFIVILAACAASYAQPAGKAAAVDTIKIWPNGAPNEFVAPPLPEHIMKFVGNSYTEALLEVYPAKKPNGLCVIMCPGGAYILESQGHEGRDLHDWFNARGICYCMLQYRLPYNGHHDVPLSDLAEAVRIMRSRADEFGISKIAVMGNSAGGHLASTLATHYDSDTRPDFQILMYPVITMEESLTNTLSRNALLGENPSKELVELYSNERHVTAETPPAFIVLCADDPDVDTRNSTMYFDKLIENKVPVSMHVYPEGGHGWGWKDSFPYKNQWVDELEKWLTSTVYPTL